MALVAKIQNPIGIIRPLPRFRNKSRAVLGNHISQVEAVKLDKNSFSNDKLFINLLQNLTKDYLSVTSKNLPLDLKIVFQETASFLLDLNPDKISIEYTYENSIVFSFIKKEEIIFFERYLDEDEEEVIFSHYKKDEKQPSFAGSFDDAKMVLSKMELCQKRNFFMV